MKLNEPISEEDHVRADAEYCRIVEGQIKVFDEIVALIRSDERFSTLQRAWVELAIQKFVKAIPLKRKRPMGKSPKVPEQAILIRQAYIEGGMKVSETDQMLATLYSVDLETFQSRIKRLSKRIDPAGCGFSKWGAN